MRRIYIYLILLIAFKANSQTSLRGMYIDHFSDIVGNIPKEDSLLQYAQDSSFNYFALYDLQSLNLSNTTTANKVGAFIKKARDNYGIQYVGAVCESYSTIESKIVPFNNNRSDDHEKFNVFNLEFEFWTNSSVTNGGYYCTRYLQQANCSCDTSGAFKFFIEQLHKIDSIAATQQVISETYVGWFNQGQAQQMAQNVDRILLHAYRTNTSSLFSYSKTRLQYLASGNSVVDVAPIFSAEPNFMGPWLENHSQQDAYSAYDAAADADGSSFLQNINFLGYQWFDWKYMPKPVPGTSGTFSPVINASGSLNICQGGDVTLTATHGDSYAWSTGATTQSITVNTSASVTCTVTLNGDTQTTPVANVSLKNLPSVSIAEGIASPGMVPLSANATAGSGSIASYQWMLNGSSIQSATTSSHNASVSGLYTVRVSNSFGCTATSGGQNITVTGAMCNPSVPSGLSSAPVTELTQTVSWTGVQSGDSIIIRYHPDALSEYSYLRMANNGQTSAVLADLLPNTLYSWRVKTVCGGSSGAYSSKDYFTTGNSTSGIPHVRDLDEEETSDSPLSIFPNPANEAISLTILSDANTTGEIVITDVNGRIVMTSRPALVTGNNPISLNTTTLSTGFYFLTIRMGNVTLLKKFIISH